MEGLIHAGFADYLSQNREGNAALPEGSAVGLEDDAAVVADSIVRLNAIVLQLRHQHAIITPADHPKLMPRRPPGPHPFHILRGYRPLTEQSAIIITCAYLHVYHLISCINIYSLKKNNSRLYS